LKFPIYDEDNDNKPCSFFLINIENDFEFLTAYKALVEAKFDLN